MELFIGILDKHAPVRHISSVNSMDDSGNKVSYEKKRLPQEKSHKTEI